MAKLRFKQMMTVLGVVGLMAGVSACSSTEKSAYDSGNEAGGNRNILTSDRGGSGGSGFSLFSDSQVITGIGVNSYLWRASLDTLSFMPLMTVDSSGGVIITDWYANPEIPAERFKVTVYILDTRLRADGLKVSVFRQQLTKNSWVDSKVNPDTAGDLENSILVRARQLKIDIGK